MDRERQEQEEYQLRLESGSEVIRILTVHKAKVWSTQLPLSLPNVSQIEKDFYLSCCLRWPQEVNLREFAREESRHRKIGRTAGSARLLVWLLPVLHPVATLSSSLLSLQRMKERVLRGISSITSSSP